MNKNSFKISFLFLILISFLHGANLDPLGINEDAIRELENFQYALVEDTALKVKETRKSQITITSEGEKKIQDMLSKHGMRDVQITPPTETKDSYWYYQFGDSQYKLLWSSDSLKEHRVHIYVLSEAIYLQSLQYKEIKIKSISPQSSPKDIDYDFLISEEKRKVFAWLYKDVFSLLGDRDNIINALKPSDDLIELKFLKDDMLHAMSFDKINNRYYLKRLTISRDHQIPLKLNFEYSFDAGKLSTISIKESIENVYSKDYAVTLIESNKINPSNDFLFQKVPQNFGKVNVIDYRFEPAKQYPVVDNLLDEETVIEILNDSVKLKQYLSTLNKI